MNLNELIRCMPSENMKTYETRAWFQLDWKNDSIPNSYEVIQNEEKGCIQLYFLDALAMEIRTKEEAQNIKELFQKEIQQISQTKMNIKKKLLTYFPDMTEGDKIVRFANKVYYFECHKVYIKQKMMYHFSLGLKSYQSEQLHTLEEKMNRTIENYGEEIKLKRLLGLKLPPF